MKYLTRSSNKIVTFARRTKFKCYTIHRTVNTVEMLIVRKPRESLRDARNILAYDSYKFTSVSVSLSRELH